LVDILRQRAHAQTSDLAYRFLLDGTSDEVVDWTYADVARYAGAVAAELREHGLDRPGARVVLALDPGPDYIAALYGVLLVGATAVPAFPPDGTRTAKRFLSIVADSRAEYVLASSRFAGRVEEFEQKLPGSARPDWILRDALKDAPPELDDVVADVAEPALLQYTSGSTGEAKGIVLTHENLLSNCRVLEHHTGFEADRVGCSWLPPYHDMGLMGTIMFALHGGWPLVTFSPMHFVQQPVRWLRAISEYGVTISVAPNFAFDLCTDHVADDELDGLDLSTLRQVFCGSEPVHQRTLDRFGRRFGPRGYDPASLIPCYGLAEATLFVSGKPASSPVRTEVVDRAALETGVARRTTAGGEGATAVVSCGRIALDHTVAIVDPDGRPLAPGEVGEVWVHGPNVAAGYFEKPEETSAAFHATLAGADDGARYLRTGDLGFMLDDELFITGRIKDLVVVAGRNIYPHDVERTVRDCDPKIRLVVAFAVDGEDAEELVVVAEYRGDADGYAADAADLRSAVVAAVTAEHGVTPGDVRFAPVGGIQTTTSGKVRRQATRELYLNDTLKRFDAPVVLT
jgi:acyl-CoA synthetase (AMP-forming)/AMP-acid ligase II